MKQNRMIWAVLAMLGLGFTACNTYEPVPEGSNVLTEAEADTLSPMMSIADFKVTFDKKDTLFSLNTIDTESPLYIRGRVVTTDESGNIYKYLVMQDTETGDALKVSIDAGSLSGAIPMGQEIVINCKGLTLGRYAGQEQLGVESFNDEKLRVEPGRIPYTYFNERLQFVGNPDVEKIYIEEMTIADMNKRINDHTLYGRLIRIKDVHFTGLGDGGEKLSEAEKIFAPSTFNGTYNVGYPQARQIADAQGNIAYVSTSEYARFADHAIPTSDKWGDVVAIVGYYKDKADAEGELQLTIRTLEDLVGFKTGSVTPDTPDTPDTPGVGEGNGTKESPYNVAAAKSEQGGKEAWVKAYIVGQVNGDWDVNMQYDAPFTGDTNDDGSIKTYGTNLLIADDATAATTAQVMPVQLPSGAVRLALNLVENPAMDSKEVLLYGKLTSYFSVPGVKEVTCAIVDGVVYGVDPTTIVTPEGSIIFEETFATSMGSFTTEDKLIGDGMSYVWSYDERYTCAKASGYVSGVRYDTESWLVSPAIALNGKEATLLFEHAAKFIKSASDEMRLFYTTDNGATWEELTIPTYPNGASWDFVSSGDVVLPAAESVKIAFVYTSTTANACTWEVKNVKVYQ